MSRVRVDFTGVGEARAQQRVQEEPGEEMAGTEKAKKARTKVGEYVERKMEEDQEAREKRDEAKAEKEDDEMEDEAEKKRKRQDEDDDDDSRAKKQSVGSSSSKVRGREGDVSEEKTVKYLKRLERQDRKKREREGDQDEGREINEVKVAGYVVNEEVAEIKMDVEEWYEEDVNGDALDPGQVNLGRKDELEFMVKKLEMFEFLSYEEAVRRGGKRPTTTKWVEGWKADDAGGRFVRCRLVGRDFKAKGVEEREDLFAAMPPLESKKLMFRMVAGGRGKRRRKGLAEVKLMFIDVRKAHLNAVSDEEEWVELPEEFWEYGRYARLKRWLYGMRKAAAGWEEDYAGRLESVGFRRGKGAPTVFFQREDGSEVGSTWG